jgi:quinate dehydrogenase (quinone)
MTTSRPSTSVSRWPIWVVALGVLVFGLLFAAGGGYLVTLGGSWYFLLAGLGLISSAFLLFKQRVAGAWLFAAVMVLTLIWALVDAGLVFWPLVSRLFALGVLSLLVALVYPTLRKANGLAGGRGGYVLGGVLAIAMAAGFWGMFQPHASVSPTGDGPGRRTGATTATTPGGSRFVALDQITRDNVKNLHVAWTFHTGDTPLSPTGNGAEDQETPLQIGEPRLFVHAP